MADTAFTNPPGHYDYDLFIVLLIWGIDGDTNNYKEHLTRTGILNNKVVLIENDAPTKASVIDVIGKVERRILNEWYENQRKTVVHAYVTGNVLLS